MRKLAAVMAALIFLILPAAGCCETVSGISDWFSTPTATPSPDAFRFRDGIRWGMNKQQVQALEPTPMTERNSDDNNTLSIMKTNGKVTVSRFTADLVFMFREDSLLMITYEFKSQTLANDYAYLSAALSSLYGEKAPAEPMKIKALMDGINPNLYKTEMIREPGVWTTSDGTTVYLYYYSSDAFAIMYVSPGLGSRVYQTNGL